MRKVVVCTNLSLDGVMQAPARPDEDLRNGFQHGGWGAPYGAMMHASHVFAAADSLLLGRRTYEDFYNVWPKRLDSPFTPWLNAVQKYVVSRTLKEPLPWENSSLLSDAVPDIQNIKQQSGKDILIMGSGELVRSLVGSHVIDEFVLLIHPLVVGEGTRLFDHDGPFARLTLVNSSTTPNGVVITTYHPEGAA